MKIALCFSGQARAFEKGYEYYKSNLLDRFDVDVYIHTWKFAEQNDLVAFYKPKACEFETPPVGDFNSKYTNTPNPIKHPPVNTYRMIYSMYRCSQLIQGKYDWIIKSRTDYALNTFIPFAELDNKFDFSCKRTSKALNCSFALCNLCSAICVCNFFAN